MNDNNKDKDVIVDDKEINDEKNKLDKKELDKIKSKWIIIQEDLKKKVKFVDDENFHMDNVSFIGGVDISFIKENDLKDPNDIKEPDACAGLTILSYPDLEIVYEKYQMVKLTQPYMVGFLAFREVDFLVDLVNELKNTKPQFVPDFIMVDGNGKLHPLGFGLACHFGCLVDIPTIGIGKNLLYVDGLTNEFVKKETNEQLKQAGDSFDLVGDSGEIHGAALRSTDKTKKPIFVSPGHRFCLKTCLEITNLVSRYRIPEPVRRADLDSRDFVRKYLKSRNVQGGKKKKNKNKKKQGKNKANIPKKKRTSF